MSIRKSGFGYAIPVRAVREPEAEITWFQAIGIVWMQIVAWLEI